MTPGPCNKIQVPMNRNTPKKTRKETAQGQRETKRQGIHEKIE